MLQAAAIELDPDKAPIPFQPRPQPTTTPAAPEEAIKSYDTAARLDPVDPMVVYHRGVTKLRLGRLTDAIADFDLSVSLQRNNQMARLYRSDCYIQLGKPAKALPDLDWLVEQQLKPPASSAATDWFSRLIEWVLNLFGMTSAPATPPKAPDKNPDVWNMRARAYTKLARFDDAIADYSTAMKINECLAAEAAVRRAMGPDLWPTDQDDWRNRGQS